jgi:hypothetical protein
MTVNGDAGPGEEWPVFPGTPPRPPRRASTLARWTRRGILPVGLALVAGLGVVAALLAWVVLHHQPSDSALSQSPPPIARTYIVLTPARPLSAAELASTVTRLQERASTLGLGPSFRNRGTATVTPARDGQTILLSLPSDSTDADTVAELIDADQVQVRVAFHADLPGVHWAVPVPAGDASMATAVGDFDTITQCPRATAAALAPTDWAVACDAAGTTKYLLRPGATLGGGDDVVTTFLDAADPTRFGVELTGHGLTALGAVAGQNGGAIVAVLDGVAMPVTVTAASEDIVTFAGLTSENDQEALSEALRFGPLPAVLVPSPVSSHLPPGY